MSGEETMPQDGQTQAVQTISNVVSEAVAVGTDVVPAASETVAVDTVACSSEFATASPEEAPAPVPPIVHGIVSEVVHEDSSSPAACEAQNSVCEAHNDVASNCPAVTPIPAESLAAVETPAVAPPPVTAEIAVQPAQEEAKKRPILNPTVDDHHGRAVGSIGSEVETEAAAVASAAAAQAAVVSTSSGPVGQIELPPKQMSLDDGLEKEIDAAMSGQMTAPTDAPAGAMPPSTAENALPPSEDQLESGTKLKAKVQSITTEDVFCEVGYRSPGVLPARQFPQGKQPRIGEEFLVIVEKYDPENSVILVNLPKATRKARGNWEELNVGQITECIVNKTNKGGLEVTVGGLRAFLPASQVDLGFVTSMDALVGQKLTVQITELNPAKRNLVVSRRAVLIAERKELAGAFWEKVEVGQQFSGNVKTIKDYGVFIDLGGADGFLHIGEMSWTRVKHPSEVLKEGQQVDVVVLSLDREKQKIGLGMRQLSHNPWGIVETTYAIGKEVSGKVTRTTDFGAFVELEPGVEGLIHISEMDHQRIRKVTDVVNVGQDVQAQVLEVAPDRQRISLSLKALKQKPEKPKDEDLSPGKGEAYERKRKEPLRGGTTTSGGGGLFGNPGDFKR